MCERDRDRDLRDVWEARAWRADLWAVRGATLCFLVVWLWPYVGLLRARVPGFAELWSDERFFWLIGLGLANGLARILAWRHSGIVLWF